MCTTNQRSLFHQIMVHYHFSMYNFLTQCVNARVLLQIRLNL